ncbi:hypothetical protein [Actinomadura roseirufa]|uniref:hypothetical protein n=1 Tax=Actinomadura roseirufa TaxID=2094049 RepID=UPI0010414B85|nr:hypothetical protein [Actinomadura roseirufa]
MVPKSFYDLRFVVPPGALRMDAHHICGSLDEVMAALDSELEHHGYLLFYSSADLALDVYQQGKRVRSIGLHPFITIRIDGRPDITFRGPGEPIDSAGAGDPEQMSVIEDGMAAGDFDGRLKFTVDWDGISAPPLVGEIVEVCDYVLLGDGPLGDLDDLDGLDEDDLEDELIDRGWVEYGYHDFES